jgi:hypothetical protein
MIEREDWYDENFTRNPQGGHYCVDCQEVVGNDMDAITHLMRSHDWDEVNFHANW